MPELKSLLPEVRLRRGGFEGNVLEVFEVFWECLGWGVFWVFGVYFGVYFGVFGIFLGCLVIFVSLECLALVSDLLLRCLELLSKPPGPRSWFQAQRGSTERFLYTKKGKRSTTTWLPFASFWGQSKAVIVCKSPKEKMEEIELDRGRKSTPSWTSKCPSLKTTPKIQSLL